MFDRNNDGKSSRQRTRESGEFVRDTHGSRSLERGLLLLRIFRGGITSVSNAEFASFSGLPRSTVSRLTKSLVDTGFLEYHVPTATYRPGPALLTLGATAHRSSNVLKIALPTMHDLADRHSINVGLAVEDAGDMVYLDSVRRNRLGTFRRAKPGWRLPVAQTALGRAWLAGISLEKRGVALQAISQRYPDQWATLEHDVRLAIEHVERHGWCAANYRPEELTAIAMPLALKDVRAHVLNISFPANSNLQLVGIYVQALLCTGLQITHLFNGPQDQARGR